MDFECYQVFSTKMKEVEILVEAAEKAFEISRKKESEVPAEESEKARVQGNATTRAGLVLLCGYFEGFIRDIAEEYVEVLNDEDLDLENFPDELFRLIIVEMIESLRARDNTAIQGFREYIKNGKHPQLNKKKFSKTGGNPTVDTIEALFFALGVPDVIDKLSVADYSVETTYISESQVQPKMRDAIVAVIREFKAEPEVEAVAKLVSLIDEKWLPKRKRRSVGYVHAIEQLLKKRNRIAHGEGDEQITADDLKSTLQCIIKLADGLHTLTKEALAELLAEPA